MAIGNTGDWCQVDAEVGDEDCEVDSELDSEIYSGSERLCRARQEGTSWHSKDLFGVDV
jgi:hypothetical protein